MSDTFEPAEIRKLRARDNREARLAVALYDSHALAVRHASEQAATLASLLRDEPRVGALQARLHALLATVMAAMQPPSEEVGKV